MTDQQDMEVHLEHSSEVIECNAIVEKDHGVMLYEQPGKTVVGYVNFDKLQYIKPAEEN